MSRLFPINFSAYCLYNGRPNSTQAYTATWSRTELPTEMPTVEKAERPKSRHNY